MRKLAKLLQGIVKRLTGLWRQRQQARRALREFEAAQKQVEFHAGLNLAELRRKKPEEDYFTGHRKNHQHY